MKNEKMIEEKCENCLHYRACILNSEYVPTLCRIYEDRTNYRKQSEWISVEDRLPEKDGRYLVAMKNGDDYHVSTRKFRRADPPIWWKGHTFGYWARYTGGVRYWMPLPEPPKGE